MPVEPRCLCLGAHVRLQRKHQRRGWPLHRSPQAECGQLWAPERSPRKRPDTADPRGSVTGVHAWPSQTPTRPCVLKRLPCGGVARTRPAQMGRQSEWKAVVALILATL